MASLPEASEDKCAGLPILPPSVAIMPISYVSTLGITSKEVGSMIEPEMLLLALGKMLLSALSESFARVSSSSLTKTLLQLLAIGFGTPALRKGPNQEDEHGSLHEPSVDTPTFASKTMYRLPFLKSL